MPITIIPKRPAFIATITRVCKDTGFELPVSLIEAVVRLRHSYQVADQQLITWLCQGHTLENDFAFYRMDGSPGLQSGVSEANKVDRRPSTVDPHDGGAA